MVKNIFGRIWATWGSLVFIVVMLIFFPFFLLCLLWKEPKRSRITYPIFRLWMNIYLPLIGVFISIKGKKYFKKGANYIVLCNHSSLMDVPVSSPYIPGPNKTIAKIEMSRIPVFGTIYKLGSVLVDRKDKDSRLKSYIRMKEVLNAGLHMCIYPEGTRNKTGLPLKEFHDGAFKLAVDSRKPIMPAVLFNTSKILSSTKTMHLLPGLIRFHFLPPVEITPATNADDLKKAVFDMMWQYYEANKSK